MSWSPDRRWDQIDIIQMATLSAEEISQITALHRHFAGNTGMTHPGVTSINFVTRSRDKKKEKNGANL